MVISYLNEVPTQTACDFRHDVNRKVLPRKFIYQIVCVQHLTEQLQPKMQIGYKSSDDTQLTSSL